jgi:hypothetical protein
MAVWKLNGRLIELKELRRELLKVGEDRADRAAAFAAKELNNIVDRLNNTTANRGSQVNRLAKTPIPGASRYNQPLRNAKVVITKVKTGKGFKYTIAVEHRGLRGGRNLFDLLDAGSPSKPQSADGPMVFPVYDGRRTAVSGRGNPKIGTAGGRIAKPLFFITKDQVQGFPGRNFYRSVADKVRRQFYAKSRDVDIKVGGKKVF